MKTVLIVEDDLINARVFSKILINRGGLAVKHTENVEELMLWKTIEKRFSTRAGQMAISQSPLSIISGLSIRCWHC